MKGFCRMEARGRNVCGEKGEGQCVKGREEVGACGSRELEKGLFLGLSISVVSCDYVEAKGIECFCDCSCDKYFVHDILPSFSFYSEIFCFNRKAVGSGK